VPDFEKTKPPTYRPAPEADGVEAIAGDDPFIMQGDGKGWLYVPSGLVDGPLPAHYEPPESLVRNQLYGQQANPVRKVYDRPENTTHPSPPEHNVGVFPYVFTIARLTEHHTAGGMSRFVEHLAELQPEMFVEVSPELAAERGLRHLDWGHVITARGAVEAKILVTDRLTPLRIEDKIVHQIWLPYHWGPAGWSTGDSANDLFSMVLDPNVLIQEGKTGTCDVRPGQRPRGPELLAYLNDYRRRAGILDQHHTPIITTDAVHESHGSRRPDNGE
jgi:formate dehydrogenase major subunit